MENTKTNHHNSVDSELNMESSSRSDLSMMDYRTLSPDQTGAMSGICTSPASEHDANVCYLKDMEAEYWKTQFFETIKQNQILHVRENYHLGRIELLESQLAIQQRTSDLNDLMMNEMLSLYHKLEEWQAYASKLEDAIRDMDSNNNVCDEEKFLLELYKFFKRSDFNGNEAEFEELIRSGRVHFYISDENSIMSSPLTTRPNTPTTAICPEDANNNTLDCEQCLSEKQDKDENDNIRTIISKRRKNKKKLSNAFWRYLRCTLAPKN